jgi:hypothetical protein
MGDVGSCTPATAGSSLRGAKPNVQDQPAAAVDHRLDHQRREVRQQHLNITFE